MGGIIIKLHSLQIKGFRRLEDVTILFDDATFLIGENNLGKSCVLKAIDYLLSAKDNLLDHDYYCEFDEDNNENCRKANEVEIIAEIRNVPEDARNWRGFKGRIFQYEIPEGINETGYCLFFKKSKKYGEKSIHALKTFKRTIKEEFAEANKPSQYIEMGLSPELINDIFAEDIDKGFTSAAMKNKQELIDEIWDIDESEEIWFDKPGGIIGNITAHLPRYLHIPAQDSTTHLSDSKKGVLAKTMEELFITVRESSKHYEDAQFHLNKLAKELDPNDDNSEFGKMMTNLNDVLKNVFPGAKIHADANLSNPNKVLNPEFNIQMSSNVVTPVENQGTGMIRAAVFALLRYRKLWEEQNDASGRSLIIGFEEPEIYLHPNATNQMRNTIYDLAGTSSQIISTTHSPFMIDLSKEPEPSQILNLFFLNEQSKINVLPFNTSSEYKKLHEDDKTYVKMILKIDDHIARIFFAQKVIIIEGDTEDIIIRKTISLLSEEIKTNIMSKVQIVNARGKGSIISLAKYLNAMGINYFVIHDRDLGITGAEKFNAPILDAIGSEDKRIMLEECLENELGYDPPSSEKPYKAYEKTMHWKEYSDIPDGWRTKFEIAFSEYL